MATDGAGRAAARIRRSAEPVGDPILASKITAPDVPGWAVPRLRITELIAQGTRRCPLTVLTGPAGAGKTMALALWAAAESSPVAWVGLDEFDNRPETFWSYVLAALRRSGVAVPATVAARGRPGDEGFVPRLTAALATQDPPVTLVLDDLHLVTEPKVLGGVDFVLRNAGAGLRLAAASRMDPLLRLHRYQVAGQLAEVRAADLAFSTAEAGLLLAQHGCTLSPDSLQSLIQRTEGWAAGLRLAALSMGAHPDPGQFVKELAAEDSALTGYLVGEVLDTQPAEVREVLLYTSILDQVSAETAVEVAGDERAAGIVLALARANAFIQPLGGGWYRYHPLFAEVLRLKLRHEHPGRVAGLYRRAARWYARNGLLADAVRHAAQAGDWELAAGLVIDDLAIGRLLEPGGAHPVAEAFREMPTGQTWSQAEPHLVSAAVALSQGRGRSCAAALDAADVLLEASPGGQQPEGCLAAALVRLDAGLRAGNLDVAVPAAARAEVLLDSIPDGKLAGHPDIAARVLSGRGAIALWSGHLDDAARLLQAGVAAWAAPIGQDEPAACVGYLALAEALRGRLRRAEQLAAQAASAVGSPRLPGRHPDPAALVALAWVHLQRYELREESSRLKHAEAALGACPDPLTGAVSCLLAAWGALARARSAVALQITARARSGFPVPAWLDQQLSLVDSRASAAAGDIPAALAAAGRACGEDSPEAAAAAAHAWTVAGDSASARRTLAPALADSTAPDRMRLLAWLTDARLSYQGGDRVRARRSLACALRLAEPEQLRLPFAMERGWIGPALRQDPELARAHWRLLAPVMRLEQPSAAPGPPGQAPILLVEPLTAREREVLRQVSRMLNNAEVANEMYISANTVKTHLRSINRKLATTHRGQAVRRARQLELI